jgi:hypothetical protein
MTHEEAGYYMVGGKIVVFEFDHDGMDFWGMLAASAISKGGSILPAVPRFLPGGEVHVPGIRAQGLELARTERAAPRVRMEVDVRALVPAPADGPTTAVGPLKARTRGVWPLNPSQEISACQFTNMPVGFSFHAQTCSV